MQTLNLQLLLLLCAIMHSNLQDLLICFEFDFSAHVEFTKQENKRESWALNSSPPQLIDLVIKCYSL